MSQGIVRVTPKASSPGSLAVTVADPNRYDVKDGSTLSFDDPGFRVEVGNTVECEITSSSTCNVTSVLETAK